MSRSISVILLLCGLLAGTAFADPGPCVVYLFDQDLDQMLQILDLNEDGDTLDPGEVTIFFDDQPAGTGVENAQALAMPALHEVLATDNFDPPNVVRLRDIDEDGDALDAGESSVWFSGQLPGGYVLDMPVALTIGPDGAQYLIDSPFDDPTNPQAIYRLEDLDEDGDVDDAGEVTMWLELAAPGEPTIAMRDLEFDTHGGAYYEDRGYAVHNGKVMRVDVATQTTSVYLDSDVLTALTGNLRLNQGWGRGVLFAPDWDELLVSAFYGVSTDVLVAVKDRNGSGAIDVANEVRVIWDQTASTHDPNVDEPRDLCRLADGSLVWGCQLFDRVWRLYDRNGDTDFNDVSEQILIYDAATAEAAGQPAARRLASVTSRLCGPVTTSADDPPVATGLPSIRVSPNPFNPATTVVFDLPAAAHVRVEVIDLRGRLIRVLADATLAAGEHRVRWDGADAQGDPVASGTYFARVHAAGVDATTRLTLTR